MNKRLIAAIFIVLSALSFSSGSSGEEKAEEVRWTPVQFAVWTPLQVFDEKWDIRGLKLDLFYGKNRKLHGIDIGLINKTRYTNGIQIGALISLTGKDLNGVKAGIISITEGGVNGIQVGILTSVVNKNLNGIQLGAFSSTEDNINGVQLGAFNSSEGNVTGLQLGMVSLTEGNLKGIQFGVFSVTEGDAAGIQMGLLNTAEKMKGLQIGVINYCRRIKGVQIGLINIIKDGKLGFFPILNAGFSVD